MIKQGNAMRPVCHVIRIRSLLVRAGPPLTCQVSMNDRAILQTRQLFEGQYNEIIIPERV